MKQNRLLSLATGVVLSASGCMSPHGGPVALYLLSALGPKGGGGYSAPNIEGTDGSSPEAALTIHTVNKEYLVSDELSWAHDRYWWPLTPGRSHTEYPQSWREFRPNATHETRRIGRSVYDLVTLRFPNGESRTNYFDVTRQRFYWPRER
jgi:hypothetical protein